MPPKGDRSAVGISTAYVAGTVLGVVPRTSWVLLGSRVTARANGVDRHLNWRRVASRTPLGCCEGFSLQSPMRAVHRKRECWAM